MDNLALTRVGTIAVGIPTNFFSQTGLVVAFSCVMFETDAIG